MAKIGSIVVSLDVDIGRMSSFRTAANQITADSNRMRTGLAATSTSVAALRTTFNQPMRVHMLSDALRTISRTNDEISRLKASMIALAAVTGSSLTAALSATYLVQAADRARLLSNSLRTVTDDQADLANMEERLYDLSQRTRSGYEATARIYARTARATEFMALSQQKLLTVTEAIQQAFAIGGATQQEAMGAAIQLSQGIASDRFSGEEFRSVAENAPVLLQGMARALGVNIGQLREMAHAGKLNAETTVNAILAAAAGINDAFQGMQMTVGQSFTQLDNAFLRYIGNTDEAYGVSRRLADGIGFLAKNFDEVAGYAGIASAAFASMFLGRQGAFLGKSIADSGKRSLQEVFGAIQAKQTELSAKDFERTEVSDELRRQSAALDEIRAQQEIINKNDATRNALLTKQAGQKMRLELLEKRAADQSVVRARADADVVSATRAVTDAEKALNAAMAQGDRLTAQAVSAQAAYTKSVDQLNAAKKAAVDLEKKHQAAVAATAARIRNQEAKVSQVTPQSVRMGSSAFGSLGAGLNNPMTAPNADEMKRYNAEVAKLYALQAKVGVESTRYNEQMTKAVAELSKRELIMQKALVAERELLEAARAHANTITDQTTRVTQLNAIRAQAVDLQNRLRVDAAEIAKQIKLQQTHLAGYTAQLKAVAVTDAQRLEITNKIGIAEARIQALKNQRTGIDAEIVTINRGLRAATASANIFSVAMNGLRATVSGIAGVMGGGWGVLLTAGIAAMIYFTGQSAKAAEETRNITKYLEDMGYLTAKAADEMNRFMDSVSLGRIDELSKMIARLRGDVGKTADDLRDLNVTGQSAGAQAFNENQNAPNAGELFNQGFEAEESFYRIRDAVLALKGITPQLAQELKDLVAVNPDFTDEAASVERYAERMTALAKASADAQMQLARLEQGSTAFGWINPVIAEAERGADAASANARMAEDVLAARAAQAARDMEILQMSERQKAVEKERLAIIEQMVEEGIKITPAIQDQVRAQAELTVEAQETLKVQEQLAAAFKESVVAFNSQTLDVGEMESPLKKLFDRATLEGQMNGITQLLREGMNETIAYLNSIADGAGSATAEMFRQFETYVQTAGATAEGAAEKITEIEKALRALGIGEGIIASITAKMTGLAQQTMNTKKAVDGLVSSLRTMYAVQASGGGTANVGVTRNSTSVGANSGFNTGSNNGGWGLTGSGSTPSTGVTPKTVSAPTSGGTIKAGARADGGFISGPGTGRSDDVLAWLSNGEFVINAESTRRWRGLLEAINGGRGKAQGSGIPQYVDGGLATGSNETLSTIMKYYAYQNDPSGPRWATGGTGYAGRFGGYEYGRLAGMQTYGNMAVTPEDYELLRGNYLQGFSPQDFMDGMYGGGSSSGAGGTTVNVKIKVQGSVDNAAVQKISDEFRRGVRDAIGGL